MHEQDVLKLFTETGALLNGHFVLRSGLHSRNFMQCATVLQHPEHAEALGQALSQRAPESDVVISPAMGGLFLGHEVARARRQRHLFVEKEDGRLVLRRGFQIEQGLRYLVVEDVMTRGGRIRETIDIVRAAGGHVAAVALLVDRSLEQPDFGVPVVSLLKLSFETFDPDALPEDLLGVPAIKPGSK